MTRLRILLSKLWRPDVDWRFLIDRNELLEHANAALIAENDRLRREVWALRGGSGGPMVSPSHWTEGSL